MYVQTCVLACCARACLPACMRAWLPACVPARVHVCLPACVRAMASTRAGTRQSPQATGTRQCKDEVCRAGPRQAFRRTIHLISRVNIIKPLPSRIVLRCPSRIRIAEKPLPRTTRGQGSLWAVCPRGRAAAPAPRKPGKQAGGHSLMHTHGVRASGRAGQAGGRASGRAVGRAGGRAGTRAGRAGGQAGSRARGRAAGRAGRGHDAVFWDDGIPVAPRHGRRGPGPGTLR